MFCVPSPAVAPERRRWPIRCLALPSKGMTMMLEIDRPMPSQLVRGCSPFASVRIPSWAMRGEQEECGRDESLCALLGVLGESAGAGEAPDDDHRRERLDCGVKAEAEQRDGARVAAVIAIVPSALM